MAVNFELQRTLPEGLWTLYSQKTKVLIARLYILRYKILILQTSTRKGNFSNSYKIENMTLEETFASP